MAHEREFQILKKLDHINIVKAIEYFDNEFKGEIHQILQFIDGMEVLDSIAQQQEGKYTEDEARKIFKQILEAIQYMHSKGVVHRDIKPQNLVVTKEQHVYVLDFNVSTQRKQDSEVFKMMTKTGTVAFSAPEIFTQKFYDEKVDVWSAGIVLYMMLSGDQPFFHEQVAKLVQSITTESPNFDGEAWKLVS